MEVSIETIKKLVELVVDNKLDSLEYDGIIITKSKHDKPIIEMVKEKEEDPLKTLVSSVSDNIPDFLRENQHLINAPPFRDPSFTKANK